MRERVAEADKSTAGPQGAASGLAAHQACGCGRAAGLDGQCAGCRGKHLSLQRSATGAGGPALAPPIVHDVLRSPGRPLEPETRSFMEVRFGHDFSGVRVHTDERAAASAEAVAANAYTVGQHVVFGNGKYQPEGVEGERLLAHELTHVVQQQGFNTVPSRLPVEFADSPREAQAALSEKMGTIGVPLGAITSAPTMSVQRQADTEAYDIKLTMPPNGVRHYKHVSRNEALEALQRFHDRVDHAVTAALEAHREDGKLLKEQWIVGNVSNWFSLQSLPEYSIWDEPRQLLTQAQKQIDAGQINETASILQMAADKADQNDLRLIEYREGSISGAERAKSGLQVVQVAAATTITVGTGGAAGVVVGTAYGGAQMVAQQATEVNLGLRKKIDWEGIGFDVLLGLVTGRMGGYFSKLLLRRLLSHPATAGLGRRSLEVAVEALVSGRISSVLQTTGKAVYDNLRGRENITLEKFIDRLIAQLLDPKSAFMDLVSSGVGANAPKLLPKHTTSTQMETGKASPPDAPLPVARELPAAGAAPAAAPSGTIRAEQLPSPTPETSAQAPTIQKPPGARQREPKPVRPVRGERPAAKRRKPHRDRGIQSQPERERQQMTATGTNGPVAERGPQPLQPPAEGTLLQGSWKPREGEAVAMAPQPPGNKPSSSGTPSANGPAPTGNVTQQTGGAAGKRASRTATPGGTRKAETSKQPQTGTKRSKTTRAKNPRKTRKPASQKTSKKGSPLDERLDELQRQATASRADAEKLQDAYRSLSASELRQRAKKGDAMAEHEYMRRSSAEVDPGLQLERHRITTSPEQREAMRQKMQDTREQAGIKRVDELADPSTLTDKEVVSGRSLKGVPKVQGGTMGAMTSDIKGFNNQILLAGSPRAPQVAFQSFTLVPKTGKNRLEPIQPPQANARARGHAEEHLVNQASEIIEAAKQHPDPAKRLTDADLKGKTIRMEIEQEVCQVCRQGVSNDTVAPGVLKQFSERYPQLTVEVANMRTSEVIRLRGGKRVENESN